MNLKLPQIILILHEFYALFCSKPPILDNKPCQPSDQRWYPHPFDRRKYYFCEISLSKYLIGSCHSFNVVPKIFESSRQMCVDDRQYQPTMNAQIRAKQKIMKPSRSGNFCDNDYDCINGMFCKNSKCQCALGYVGINSLCIKLSEVCPRSHYYADKSSGKPRLCISDSHCPLEFKCELHSKAEDISFCCYGKLQDDDICGSTNVMIQDNRAVQCSLTNHCPENFACSYNEKFGSSYCCQMTPKITTIDNRKFNKGEKEFDYKFSNNRMKMIVQANEACGRSREPWFYENFPMMCRPNMPTMCPVGYGCLAKSGSNLHFCCKKDQYAQQKEENDELNREHCPSGYATIDNVVGSSTSCSEEPWESNRCPRGARCLFIESKNRHQCCSYKFDKRLENAHNSWAKVPYRTPSDAGFCASGQVMLKQMNDQQPVYCIPEDQKSCPTGYFCQISLVIHRFVCCGVSAGCPNSKIAYLSPHTNLPKKCTLNDASNQCPIGFECQKIPGRSSTMICCSSSKMNERVESKNSAISRESLTLIEENKDKICPVGEPISSTDRNGFKSCEIGADNCPYGYTCFPSVKGEVCCPDAAAVCSKPLSTEKWCDSTQDATTTIRHYFDSKSGVCRSFKFSGCNGNDNNFESAQECSTFCIKGLCAPKLTPFDANYGSMRCTTYDEKQCPRNTSCQMRNFDQRQVSVCCPKPELICHQKPDPGSNCQINSQPILRFFYNPVTKSCQSFLYNGCRGNENNFMFLSQCELFCNEKYPDRKTSLTIDDRRNININSKKDNLEETDLMRVRKLIESTSLAPRRLATNDGTLDFGNGRTVAMDVCPNGGETIPYDYGYHMCNQHASKPCPAGFTCQFSSKVEGYVCCGKVSTSARALYATPGKLQQCLDGEPYFYPGTYQPLMCSPGSQCPKSYECIWSFLDSYYICCPRRVKRK